MKAFFLRLKYTLFPFSFKEVKGEHRVFFYGERIGTLVSHHGYPQKTWILYTKRGKFRVGTSLKEAKNFLFAIYCLNNS